MRIAHLLIRDFPIKNSLKKGNCASHLFQQLPAVINWFITLNTRPSNSLTGDRLKSNTKRAWSGATCSQIQEVYVNMDIRKESLG